MSNNEQQSQEQDFEEEDSYYPPTHYDPFRITLPSLEDLINLERKVKRNKRIIFNITGTKYPIISQVAEDFFTWTTVSNPKELDGEWNITWTDSYVQTEQFKSMMPYQKINHFPGSFQLGRKNLLFKNLHKMQRIAPKQYDFLPKTWLLPNQWDELKAYSNSFQTSAVKPVFIYKPEASCQGKGIFLTKKIETIGSYEHCVVQEYLAEPLLIDGLKFDLRIYAMVKSINPLKVFVYREGMARFATAPYEHPKKGNMKNMCMHLTNYSVNKKSPEFVANKEELEDDKGHKRSLTSVLRLLENQGLNSDKIFSQISQLIVKTIISAWPHLNHDYKMNQPREEHNELAFEVFGFDVILDKYYKPWLLEVNHSPSFHTESAFDLQLKKNLLLDTMVLANVSNKPKKLYNENKGIPFADRKKQSKIEARQLQIQLEQTQEWEDDHMGGYYRAIPNKREKLMNKYKHLLDISKSVWNDNSILRKRPKFCTIGTEQNDQESPRISAQPGKIRRTRPSPHNESFDNSQTASIQESKENPEQQKFIVLKQIQTQIDQLISIYDPNMQQKIDIDKENATFEPQYQKIIEEASNYIGKPLTRLSDINLSPNSKQARVRKSLSKPEQYKQYSSKEANKIYQPVPNPSAYSAYLAASKNRHHNKSSTPSQIVTQTEQDEKQQGDIYDIKHQIQPNSTQHRTTPINSSITPRTSFDGQSLKDLSNQYGMNAQVRDRVALQANQTGINFNNFRLTPLRPVNVKNKEEIIHAAHNSAQNNVQNRNKVKVKVHKRVPSYQKDQQQLQQYQTFYDNRQRSLYSQRNFRNSSNNNSIDEINNQSAIGIREDEQHIQQQQHQSRQVPENKNIRKKSIDAMKTAMLKERLISNKKSLEEKVKHNMRMTDGFSSVGKPLVNNRINLDGYKPSNMIKPKGGYNVKAKVRSRRNESGNE